jgi:Cu+-exporting ATPase
LPGVEQASSHPLAKAVVQAALSRGHRIPQIQDGTFEQEPGSGASATIDGRRIAVGSLDWVERQVSNSQASVSKPQNPGEPTSAPEPHNPAQPTGDAAKPQGLNAKPQGLSAKPQGLGRLSELAGEGQTVIYVSIDGQVAGAVAMADEIRSDAAETVEGLRRLGLQTAMVSGDKQAAAEAVAKKVGIDGQQVQPPRFVCALQRATWSEVLQQYEVSDQKPQISQGNGVQKKNLESDGSGK